MPKKITITPLEAAKTFRKLGWHVLPLYGIDGKKCRCGDVACTSPGKHPSNDHGVLEATRDKATIRNWFSNAPCSNIGIATGEKSMLLVLDIDDRHGGEETLKKAIESLGPLPPTLTAKTGGGRHLYFEMPDATIKKDSHGKLIGPGIDVMVNGCYVVGPGSLHASGKPYSWTDGGPTKHKPAKLPASWIEGLTRKKKSGKEASTAGVVAEGQRNNELAAVVGRLLASGLTPEIILVTALNWNDQTCKPPLHRAEVEKVVASILGYGANAGDPGEYLLAATLGQHYAGGSHLAFGSDGRFWRYDGQKWLPHRNELMKGDILKTIPTLPQRAPGSTVNAIDQVMKLLPPTLSQRPLIDLAEPLPPVINCANGELWLKQDGTCELRPHSPDSKLRHCLEIEYDPKATCPLFDAAVSEIFSRAKDPKEMTRHWYELMGYFIQPSRKIPLILILYGGGGNGKTALVKMIAKLMGSDLIHWDRISEAANNRFFFGSLEGKLMLVDDDVTIGTRLPDGELKKISEEKILSGERKFGAPFNFICRSTPVLLCNSPMSLSDVGAGIKRRLMVIPFERRFDDKEADKDLFARIAAAELPGILNRAVQGWQRVVRRDNRFDIPKDVKKAGDRWFDEANPTAAFIAECCEQGVGYSLEIGTLYDAFKQWCEGQGIKMVLQKNNFSRNMQNILGRGTKKTHRSTAIVGVRLKG